jgi:hypothetical protein
MADDIENRIGVQNTPHIEDWEFGIVKEQGKLIVVLYTADGKRYPFQFDREYAIGFADDILQAAKAFHQS